MGCFHIYVIISQEGWGTICYTFTNESPYLRHKIERRERTV
jgi:hypothetical protein